MSELFQRRLQGSLFDSGHVAKKTVGEAAADHRADLRHLARRTEPVEPGHQRLLQGRRDSLDATTPLAALQQKPRHLLDEQRHAAGARGESTTSRGSAWRADSSATMSRTCARSSGAREMVPWCERMPQGGRNSGRVVAAMNKGASAPRSAMPRRTSSVVGSAQCRSSNASTTG
jgi:hypothetical protein